MWPLVVLKSSTASAIYAHTIVRHIGTAAKRDAKMLVTHPSGTLDPDTTAQFTESARRRMSVAAVGSQIPDRTITRDTLNESGLVEQSL